MRGRYTTYSTELAAEICARVAEGWTLKRVARTPGMPGRSTIGLWLAEREAFRTLYQAARAQRPKMLRGVADPTEYPPTTRRRGYSRARGEAICAQVEAGASLNQVVKNRRSPQAATIYEWLGRHEDFRRMYLAACEVRADRLIDEAMSIADDVAGDVRRDRLRIDIRKWRVGVMEPRRIAKQERDLTPRPITLEEALLKLDEESGGELSRMEPEE